MSRITVCWLTPWVASTSFHPLPIFALSLQTPNHDRFYFFNNQPQRRIALQAQLLFHF
jgi:hypothetical protein